MKNIFRFLLFFVCLSSSYSFSQTTVAPSCPSSSTLSFWPDEYANPQNYNMNWANVNTQISACSAAGGIVSQMPGDSHTPYSCLKQCSCPSGYLLSSTFSTITGQGGAICTKQVPLPSSSSSSSSSSDSSSSSSNSSIDCNNLSKDAPIPQVCLQITSSSAAASSVSASNGGSNTSDGSGSGSSSGAGTGGSSSSSSSGNNPNALTDCELTFGVGNCAPVASNSPCPNQYTVDGQTFCVSLTKNNSSASSVGSSSGVASSAGHSQAWDCDPTSKDYLTCFKPTMTALPDPTATDSGAKDVDTIFKNFNTRLNNSPIVSSFTKFKNLVTLSNAQCPVLGFTIFNRYVSTDIHCNLWAICATVLSPIMIALWSFIAFRIFASA